VGKSKERGASTTADETKKGAGKYICLGGGYKSGNSNSGLEDVGGGRLPAYADCALEKKKTDN